MCHCPRHCVVELANFIPMSIGLGTESEKKQVELGVSWNVVRTVRHTI